MIKIAIIGAGNAGCITALHFYKYISEKTSDFEIDIYHSPIEHPIEKVGADLRVMMPWIEANKVVDKTKN